MPASTLLVSVIVPGWNVAPYLDETLHSIAEQGMQDFEVIMVDDGSSDATFSIMEAWSKKDIRYHAIKLATNSGIVAARNAALAVTKGEFIAMLDGDDLWTPDALDIRLDAAKAFPEAVVIATDFSWFESVPDPTPSSRVTRGPRARKAFSPAYETGQPMLLQRPFDTVASLHFAWVGATLVRRQAITEVGNFDTHFKGPEDTLLWLKLANRGAFVFVPRVTAHYRQRVGSLVNLYREPKEFHYLKVLDYLLQDALFSHHKQILLRLKSECHTASSLHFRRRAEWHKALAQALQGIRVAPMLADNWRNALAALLRR